MNSFNKFLKNKYWNFKKMVQPKYKMPESQRQQIKSTEMLLFKSSHPQL